MGHYKTFDEFCDDLIVDDVALESEVEVPDVMEEEESDTYVTKARESITELKNTALALITEKENKATETNNSKAIEKYKKLREKVEELWAGDGKSVSNDKLNTISKKFNTIVTSLSPATEGIIILPAIRDWVEAIESLVECGNCVECEDLFNAAMEGIESEIGTIMYDITAEALNEEFNIWHEYSDVAFEAALDPGDASFNLSWIKDAVGNEITQLKNLLKQCNSRYVNGELDNYAKQVEDLIEDATKEREAYEKGSKEPTRANIQNSINSISAKTKSLKGYITPKYEKLFRDAMNANTLAAAGFTKIEEDIDKAFESIEAGNFDDSGFTKGESLWDFVSEFCTIKYALACEEYCDEYALEASIWRSPIRKFKDDASAVSNTITGGKSAKYQREARNENVTKEKKHLVSDVKKMVQNISRQSNIYAKEIAHFENAGIELALIARFKRGRALGESGLSKLERALLDLENATDANKIQKMYNNAVTIYNTTSKRMEFDMKNMRQKFENKKADRMANTKDESLKYKWGKFNKAAGKYLEDHGIINPGTSRMQEKGERLMKSAADKRDELRETGEYLKGATTKQVEDASLRAHKERQENLTDKKVKHDRNMKEYEAQKKAEAKKLEAEKAAEAERLAVEKAAKEKKSSTRKKKAVEADPAPKTKDEAKADGAATADETKEKIQKNKDIEALRNQINLVDKEIASKEKDLLEDENFLKRHPDDSEKYAAEITDLKKQIKSLNRKKAGLTNKLNGLSAEPAAASYVAFMDSEEAFDNYLATEGITPEVIAGLTDEQINQLAIYVGETVLTSRDILEATESFDNLFDELDIAEEGPIRAIGTWFKNIGNSRKARKEEEAKKDAEAKTAVINTLYESCKNMKKEASGMKGTFSNLLDRLSESNLKKHNIVSRKMRDKYSAMNEAPDDDPAKRKFFSSDSRQVLEDNFAEIERLRESGDYQDIPLRVLVHKAKAIEKQNSKSLKKIVKAVGKLNKKLGGNKHVIDRIAAINADMPRLYDEALKENAKYVDSAEVVERTTKARVNAYRQVEKELKDRAARRATRDAATESYQNFLSGDLLDVELDEIDAAFEAYDREIELKYHDFSTEAGIAAAIESVIINTTFQDDASLYVDMYCDFLDEIAEEGAFTDIIDSIRNADIEDLTKDVYNGLLLVIEKICAFLHSTEIVMKKAILNDEIVEAVFDNLEEVMKTKLMTDLCSGKYEVMLDEKVVSAFERIVRNQCALASKKYFNPETYGKDTEKFSSYSTAKLNVENVKKLHKYTTKFTQAKNTIKKNADKITDGVSVRRTCNMLTVYSSFIMRLFDCAITDEQEMAANRVLHL